MATKKAPATDIESALKELEGLVEALEQGELTLEDALTRYERGVALARTCQGLLGAAEQRIELLQGQAGADTLVPWTPPAGAPATPQD